MMPIPSLRYVVSLLVVVFVLWLPIMAHASEPLASNSSLALLDGEILFGIGEFELTPDGQSSLDNLMEELSRFKGILSIRIIGHTDSAGSAAANLALSQRRANWIRDQFVQLYPQAHVRSIGAGESAPLTSNQTLAERQRNRRVEVQVIATGTP